MSAKGRTSSLRMRIARRVTNSDSEHLPDRLIQILPLDDAQYVNMFVLDLVEHAEIAHSQSVQRPLRHGFELFSRHSVRIGVMSQPFERTKKAQSCP